MITPASAARATTSAGLGRRAPRDERGVAGLGDDLGLLGQELAAAGGGLASPSWPHSGAVSSAASSPAIEAVGIQPASKRAAPAFGMKEPSGSYDSWPR